MDRRRFLAKNWQELSDEVDDTPLGDDHDNNNNPGESPSPRHSDDEAPENWTAGPKYCPISPSGGDCEESGSEDSDEERATVLIKSYRVTHVTVPRSLLPQLVTAGSLFSQKRDNRKMSDTFSSHKQCGEFDNFMQTGQSLEEYQDFIRKQPNCVEEIYGDVVLKIPSQGVVNRERCSSPWKDCSSPEIQACENLSEEEISYTSVQQPNEACTTANISECLETSLGEHRQCSPPMVVNPAQSVSATGLKTRSSFTVNDLKNKVTQIMEVNEPNSNTIISANIIDEDTGYDGFHHCLEEDETNSFPRVIPDDEFRKISPSSQVKMNGLSARLTIDEAIGESFSDNVDVEEDTMSASTLFPVCSELELHKTEAKTNLYSESSRSSSECCPLIEIFRPSTEEINCDRGRSVDRETPLQLLPNDSLGEFKEMNTRNDTATLEEGFFNGHHHLHTLNSFLNTYKPRDDPGELIQDKHGKYVDVLNKQVVDQFQCDAQSSDGCFDGAHQTRAKCAKASEWETGLDGINPSYYLVNRGEEDRWSPEQRYEEYEEFNRRKCLHNQVSPHSSAGRLSDGSTGTELELDVRPAEAVIAHNAIRPADGHCEFCGSNASEVTLKDAEDNAFEWKSRPSRSQMDELEDQAGIWDKPGGPEDKTICQDKDMNEADMRVHGPGAGQDGPVIYSYGPVDKPFGPEGRPNKSPFELGEPQLSSYEEAGQPDGPEMSPNGEVDAPDGPEISRCEEVDQPDGPEVSSYEEVDQPDGPEMSPNGAVDAPDGPEISRFEEVDQPDGPQMSFHRAVDQPDGPEVSPNGAVVEKDEPEIRRCEEVDQPDGPEVSSYDETDQPDKPEMSPNGAVDQPAGPEISRCEEIDQLYGPEVGRCEEVDQPVGPDVSPSGEVDEIKVKPNGLTGDAIPSELKPAGLKVEVSKSGDRPAGNWEGNENEVILSHSEVKALSTRDGLKTEHGLIDLQDDEGYRDTDSVQLVSKTGLSMKLEDEAILTELEDARREVTEINSRSTSRPTQCGLSASFGLSLEHGILILDNGSPPSCLPARLGDTVSTPLEAGGSFICGESQQIDRHSSSTSEKYLHVNGNIDSNSSHSLLLKTKVSSASLDYRSVSVDLNNKRKTKSKQDNCFNGSEHCDSNGQRHSLEEEKCSSSTSNGIPSASGSSVKVTFLRRSPNGLTHRHEVNAEAKPDENKNTCDNSTSHRPYWSPKADEYPAELNCTSVSTKESAPSPESVQSENEFEYAFEFTSDSDNYNSDQCDPDYSDLTYFHGEEHLSTNSMGYVEPSLYGMNAGSRESIDGTQTTPSSRNSCPCSSLRGKSDNENSSPEVCSHYSAQESKGHFLPPINSNDPYVRKLARERKPKQKPFKRQEILKLPKLKSAPSGVKPADRYESIARWVHSYSQYQQRLNTDVEIIPTENNGQDNSFNGLATQEGEPNTGTLSPKSIKPTAIVKHRRKSKCTTRRKKKTKKVDGPPADRNVIENRAAWPPFSTQIQPEGRLRRIHQDGNQVRVDYVIERLLN